MDEHGIEWGEGVRLSRAIAARLGERDAMIVDIDVDRLLIDHDDPIEPGEMRSVEFTFEDQRFAFSALVESRAPRLVLGQKLWRSVLSLPEREHDSRLMLAEAVSAYSSRVLQALEANALGTREANRLEGDETITTLGAAARLGGASFIVYTFDGTSWSKRTTLLPAQPDEGFTISSAEVASQVEDLCRAYETADEEGRNLIRIMAQMSVEGLE